MSDFKYELLRSIAVLSESSKGWRKEINVVNWNDRGPKLDIREWSPNYERMSRGLTLNREEALCLQDALAGIDFADIGLA